MSPVEGFVRNRRHQFGRQSALGTKVAAAAAYPLSGVPTVDLGWTDRVIDVGSIDMVASPVRGAPNLQAPLTDPGVEYNTLPLLLAAILGGGATPTGAGTAQAWSWAPASTTVDTTDAFTYEFGDDVASDWYQFGDCVLESLELVGPAALGPFTGSYGWRMGSVASSGSTDASPSPSVPTDLAVDPNGVILYLKDMGIYIASSTAGLAAGQVTNALVSVTFRISGPLDLKRWADATQEFNIQGYGRSARLIELICTFSKTSDTVGTGSESDAWMSDDAVTRYVELKATSKVLAQTSGAIPYSLDLVMPMRYYTRTEGATGGNSEIVLTGRAFYDADDLGGVLTADVVCTRTTI